MEKYKWSVSKTLEYLCHKKPDIIITTEILEGLRAVENDIEGDQNLFEVDSDKDKSQIKQNDPFQELNPEEILFEDEMAMFNSYKNSVKPK